MSHNITGMAPFVGVSRGRNPNMFYPCQGGDLPPPQHQHQMPPMQMPPMRSPCYMDDKQMICGMPIGGIPPEFKSPPVSSMPDSPGVAKKKRRTSNATSAPAPPPQMSPIIDMMPPPPSGYGDTIVASNPFDDSPHQILGPPPPHMGHLPHGHGPPMNHQHHPINHMPSGPAGGMGMAGPPPQMSPHPMNPMVPMGGGMPSPIMGGGSPMGRSPMSSPMGMMGGPNTPGGMPPNLPPNMQPPNMPPNPMQSNMPPNGPPNMPSPNVPHNMPPNLVPNSMQMNMKYEPGNVKYEQSSVKYEPGPVKYEQGPTKFEPGPVKFEPVQHPFGSPGITPKPMPVCTGKVYPPDQPMVFNPQNPNAPPIYPCGICHKEVHDNDQAILCESGCNFWFHRVCTGLTEPAYQLLTQEVYAEWVCDKCLNTKNIPLVKFKP